MLSFIKYIAPSWYYNLKSNTDFPYFIDYTKVTDKHIIELIDKTNVYSNKAAEKVDYAYQLWLKGFILSTTDYRLNYDRNQISIADSYIFVKRFYHPIWIIVVFLFRILELRNPIKEIWALVNCIKIKRINIFLKPLVYDINNKEYSILRQNPKVSVIIPTLNRYEYLNDVLLDLEKQSYKNFEVLIVDQSEPFRSEFYCKWNLDLKVWQQKEKALWMARNFAINKASGAYILLYDDDSLVDEDWILNHLKCIEFFNCDISSGVSISVVGGKVPEHYSYFRWSDQIDTGNVLIKRKVFEQIGLFDLQFEKQRQGDGEFGLRAYLNGFKNVSNPYANRIHLKAGNGGLREIGTWDGWRPKNFFAPRPVPSVLYLLRKYFGNAAAIREIAISGTMSIVPYQLKRHKIALVLGFILTIITYPIHFISFIRSWFLASHKLKFGAIIPSLDSTKV